MTTTKKLFLGDAPHRVSVRVFADPGALGAHLARELLRGIRTARTAGRRFLLGCPGGRSLKSTYQAMGTEARRQGADLSHVIIVMMDEYVTADAGGYVYAAEDVHYSCRRFAREEIRAVLNSGLHSDRQIPESQVWFPDPDRADVYDGQISAAGGVNVFLVASGASDGHVAFNPPGSNEDTITRVVPLADTTRQDNMATFPDFASRDDVSSHGVTVGLGTIRQQSERVVLVIHGADKRNAVQRLMACRDFSPDWPASIVFRCRQPNLYLDESAAGAMEEVPCPAT